jgi:hypothetical protein
MIKFLLPLALVFWALTPQARSNDLLFIGNSFTFGGPPPTPHFSGGVPALVQQIAASKGKVASAQMLAVGGKDWGFYLQAAGAQAILNAKSYDWVVLQDYSTKPTHLGNVSEFIKNGEAFYHRIREHSPKTKIVLYETWARAKGHPYYTGTSTPKSFADPIEMNRELEKNYARLESDLEHFEPGEQVWVAPVGTAFAHCLKEHPEVNLYGPDKYHASLEGSYLAALVIYSTIFEDSPLGAASSFEAAKLDPAVAAKLQATAQEIVGANLAQHLHASAH